MGKRRHCVRCGTSLPAGRKSRHCTSCKSHYQRRWRQAHRVELPAKTPELVLDLLTVDRGWWCSDALGEALQRKRDTVDRALFRMKERGLVESRKVDRQDGLGRATRYCEWRAAR